MSFYIHENGDYVGIIKSLTKYEHPSDYITKQHNRYATALAQDNQDAALDALWRAANHLDLLPEGKQWIEADEANIYTRRLGWADF